MNFRNAKYNAFGTIDCEIEHPVYGWIPFTAAPDDPEKHGRDIYAEVLKAGPSEYVAPVIDPAEALASWRETADMNKGEFCIGLKRLGVLPAAEAVAASKGEWPATFEKATADLPIDPDEAAIIWAATTRVRRNHPILLALIPKSSLTDAQVDALFGRVEP